jgi:hypothetical protein
MRLRHVGNSRALAWFDRPAASIRSASSSRPVSGSTRHIHFQVTPCRVLPHSVQITEPDGRTVQMSDTARSSRYEEDTVTHHTFAVS